MRSSPHHTILSAILTSQNTKGAGVKKKDVVHGERYIAKVSNAIVTVRILRDNPYGGWIAKSEKTGREVTIRSAQRLRGKATP